MRTYAPSSQAPAAAPLRRRTGGDRVWLAAAARRLRRAAAGVALCAVFAGANAVAAEPSYKRSVERYTVPAVVLVNQDGVGIPLRPYLETADRLVVVEFIYATCTTICPVLSAGFVNLQRKLAPGTDRVRLVSISIDPEHDTPREMKVYLGRYQAQPGWDFLTGSRADIDSVMRAFAAWVPNKMAHYPLTLIRRPAAGDWVRINGLTSTSELLEECRKAGLQ